MYIPVLMHFVGSLQDSSPVAVNPRHADSLLLAVLGVALLLLSALARGLSGWVHSPEEDPEGAVPRDPADSPVIEVIPTYARASASASGRPKPLLSVDVEDYFQTEAFSSAAPRRDWDNIPLRVVDNTRRMLDIFDAYDAKATFFIVGWIANRAPNLVREIAARGHELACHSYWHRTVYSLSPAEFRQDTRDAMRAIEDAAGIAVNGYRAPTWSITHQSLWAIDILAQEGASLTTQAFTPFTTICMVFRERWTARMCGGVRITSYSKFLRRR